MRIAKKDIERLTYVENALSKRDDHLAKVVHNVLHELNPEFIFIIQEEGTRVARQDMLEWVRDPSKLEESEQIDEETQTASYKVCNIDNEIYFHDTITITKKEVV